MRWQRSHQPAAGALADWLPKSPECLVGVATEEVTDDRNGPFVSESIEHLVWLRGVVDRARRWRLLEQLRLHVATAGLDRLDQESVRAPVRRRAEPRVSSLRDRAVEVTKTVCHVATLIPLPLLCRVGCATELQAEPRSQR